MLAFYERRDQTSVMKDNHLSIQAKALLAIRYRETRDGRECDRIKAVLLALEAWSVSMIAQPYVWMKARFVVILQTMLVLKN